jgi:hypothetical protein
MDIIVFNDPANSTVIQYGDIINGLDTKMWIERYASSSEFTFTASATGDIQKRLPIGALVSQVNSPILMHVENHEIVDNEGEDPTLTVTGRGYETFFDCRVVGSSQPGFPKVSWDEYGLNAMKVGQQIKFMFDEHAVNDPYNPDNNIPNIYCYWDGTGPNLPVERTVKRGPLYGAMEEMAKIDDLGIKAIRPYPSSQNGSANKPYIIIYSGVDRSKQVMLSYSAGDIIGGDYLWSNKTDKNAALVSGKWFEVVVYPTEIGAKRRWMWIEAKDIDGEYQNQPSDETTINAIVAALTQRGKEVLSSQNPVILTKAEPSKEGLTATYREDYEVGDLISIYGQYNETTRMRVSEYVEMEDENGENGYPTLIVDDYGSSGGGGGPDPGP